MSNCHIIGNLMSRLKSIEFRGGASFVDRLCCLRLVFVMLWRLFVAALWSPERGGGGAGLLALVCGVYCVFAAFQFGVLGQVLYLIVSIPDPYCLSYFHTPDTLSGTSYENSVYALGLQKTTNKNKN